MNVSITIRTRRPTFPYPACSGKLSRIIPGFVEINIFFLLFRSISRSRWFEIGNILLWWQTPFIGIWRNILPGRNILRRNTVVLWGHTVFLCGIGWYWDPGPRESLKFQLQTSVTGIHQMIWILTFWHCDVLKFCNAIKQQKPLCFHGMQVGNGSRLNPFKQFCEYSLWKTANVLLRFHISWNLDFHAIASKHFVVGCNSILSPNDISENYCNCSYNANPTAMAIFLQGKNIIIQHPQCRECIGALHLPKKGSSERTEPLHLVWSAAIVCTVFPLLLVTEGKVQEPDNTDIVWNFSRAGGMKTAIAKKTCPEAWYIIRGSHNVSSIENKCCPPMIVS